MGVIKEPFEKDSTSENTTEEAEEETCPQDTGGDFTGKQSENEVMDINTAEQEDADKSKDVTSAANEDGVPTPSEKGAQPQEQEMEVSNKQFQRSSTSDLTTKEAEEVVDPRDTEDDFTGKQSENEVMEADMDEQEEADRSRENATPEASDDAVVSLMDMPSLSDL